MARGRITTNQITDFTSAVSAIGNNLPKNISNNGYTKLPNGIIIQWGLSILNTPITTYAGYTDIMGAIGSWDTNPAGGLWSISFPIMFPNACLNVVCNIHTDYSAAAAPLWHGLLGFDKSGFLMASTTNKTWIAIGY